jgi:hypothetical protein
LDVLEHLSGHDDVECVLPKLLDQMGHATSHVDAGTIDDVDPDVLGRSELGQDLPGRSIDVERPDLQDP